MKPAFQVGDWLVEAVLNRISRQGEVLHLEPKVMDLLLYLSEHAGCVAPKDELLKEVWGDACVTDDVLTRCVFELRKALGDNPRLPRYIETVPKRGYRLIATVAEASERVARGGTPRTRRWMFLKTALVLGIVAIMAVLLGSNRLRKSRAMAASARAHENFLKAQQYCNQGTLSLWDENGANAPSRALMYYAEAIQDDPYAAEIHSGLATCYDHLVDRAKMLPTQGWTNARKAAEKALAINPNLSSPHVILGKAKLFLDHDWESAEQELRAAVAKDPDSVEARLTLAEHLCRSGKNEQAQQEAETVRASSAVAPEIIARLGTLFFYLRRYQDAEAEFKRAIGLDANNPLPHYWLSLLYETQHRYPEWLDQRLRAFQSSGTTPESVERFRRAYVRGGYDGFWRMQLEVGREWGERHPETPLTLNYARILLRLHDEDRALAYLKQALEESDPDLFDLTVDPLYDPIRHDSRFRDVIAQLGANNVRF